MSAAKTVTAALAQSDDALAGIIQGHIDELKQKHGYDLTIRSPSTITELEECFNLVKSNLQSMYEKSSFGWDEEFKRAEMHEAPTRYLLLHDKAELIAFLSFQIEDDDNQAISYLYELHVRPSYQGAGFGSSLLAIFEDLSRHLKLTKTMMTVFRANEGAVKLYMDKFKYQVDPSSPKPRRIRTALHNADYMILSRSL